MSTDLLLALVGVLLAIAFGIPSLFAWLSPRPVPPRPVGLGTVLAITAECLLAAAILFLPASTIDEGVTIYCGSVISPNTDFSNAHTEVLSPDVNGHIGYIQAPLHNPEGTCGDTHQQAIYYAIGLTIIAIIGIIWAVRESQKPKSEVT